MHHIEAMDALQQISRRHEGMLVSHVPPDLAVTQMADMLHEVLQQNYMANRNAVDAPSTDLRSLVVRLQRAIGREDEDLDLRRRRTASGSSSRVSATPTAAVSLASRVRQEIQAAMMACEDGRHDMLRQVVVGLVEYLQMLATQLHVVVLLITDLLPQPIAETNAYSPARRFGQGYARDLVDQLHGAFKCDAETTFQNSNFDVGQGVQVIQGVNPMLTELMAFMEYAPMWDFSESEDDFRANGSVSGRMSTYIGGSGMPEADTQEIPTIPAQQTAVPEGSNDTLDNMAIPEPADATRMRFPGVRRDAWGSRPPGNSIGNSSATRRTSSSTCIAGFRGDEGLHKHRSG